jgi:hypothetical protein
MIWLSAISYQHPNTKVMASFHCSVKIGGKGRAGKHADYIEREGEYAAKSNSKESKLEDLEHKFCGNMPVWAKHDAGKFWRAADEHERANGATYREIEVALPRELTPDQRRALVEDFIAQELGDRHAYTYAIHIPKASLEKGDQPHAHIMYSERTVDGIDRDPAQYFKRYNSKSPEKGGCKKDSAGTKERLLATRELFANVQNAHLEKAGSDARVSHLSLKDQGIDRKPEKHLGPVQVKHLPDFDVSALLARRAAEGELERSLQARSTIDITGDLKAAIKERDDLRAATFASIGKHGRTAGRYSETLARIGGFTQSDHSGLAQEHRAIETLNAGVGQAIAARRYGRDAGATLEAVGAVVGRAHGTIAKAVNVVQSIAKAQAERDQLQSSQTIKQGIADARAQFEQHKQIEAGKLQARQAFERQKLDQERELKQAEQAAEVKRLDEIERQPPKPGRDNGYPR